MAMRQPDPKCDSLLYFETLSPEAKGEEIMARVWDLMANHFDEIVADTQITCLVSLHAPLLAAHLNPKIDLNDPEFYPGVFDYHLKATDDAFGMINMSYQFSLDLDPEASEFERKLGFLVNHPTEPSMMDLAYEHIRPGSALAFPEDMRRLDQSFSIVHLTPSKDDNSHQFEGVIEFFRTLRSTREQFDRFVHCLELGLPLMAKSTGSAQLTSGSIAIIGEKDTIYRIADIASIKKPDWYYSGDMDIETGGLFFRPTPGEMTEAVTVSRAPDDGWIIQHGGVLMMRNHLLEDALDTCGYELIDSPELTIRTPDNKLVSGMHALVLKADAYHAYGSLENSDTLYVSEEDLKGRRLRDYIASEFPDLAPALPQDFNPPDESPSP